MACRDIKDLARRTTSDKFLRDKAFNIAKTLNVTDIKRGWLLWFTKFFKKLLLNVVALLRLQINLPLITRLKKI